MLGYAIPRSAEIDTILLRRTDKRLFFARENSLPNITNQKSHRYFSIMIIRTNFSKSGPTSPN